MGSQTWKTAPLSAKLGIFILGALMTSFISTIMFARPASAESFLSNTVDCVVSILVPRDCEELPLVSVLRGTEESPPAASSSGSTPVSPAQTQGGSGAAEQPAAPQQAQQTVAYAPLPEVEAKELAVAPKLATPAVDTGRSYSNNTYLAMLYVQGGDVATAKPHLVEATASGWHILGVAWYWYGVAIIGLVAGVVGVRKVKHKEFFSIVKP